MAPPATAGRELLVVRVVDMGGSAVRDARVRAFLDVRDELGGELEDEGGDGVARAVGVTDADGRCRLDFRPAPPQSPFTLEERGTRVCVEADGFLSLQDQPLPRARRGQGDGAVEFRLRHGRGLRGTVVGPDRRPAANAIVRATARGAAGRDDEPFARCATDADGRFELELGEGRRDVRLWAARADLGAAHVAVGDVEAGRDVEVPPIALRARGEIEGQLLIGGVAPPGAPVRAALIEAFAAPDAGPEGTPAEPGLVDTRTDARGQFRFATLRPGLWKLSCPAAARVLDGGLRLQPELDLVRTGTLGARLEGAGVVLQIEVREPDGRALPGVRVTVRGDDRDEDEPPALPQTRRTRVHRPGTPALATFVVPCGARLRVTLMPSPHFSLEREVLVRDASGRQDEILVLPPRGQR